MPVVTTAAKKRPSKRRSRARNARQHISGAIGMAHRVAKCAGDYSPFSDLAFQGAGHSTAGFDVLSHSTGDTPVRPALIDRARLGRSFIPQWRRGTLWLSMFAG